MFILGGLSFIPVIIKEGIRKNILTLMLFGFFSLLAWKAVRSLQMFGFFFIPLTARNLFVLLESFSSSWRNFLNKLLLLAAILILGAGTTLKNFYYYLNLQNLQNPVDFFRNIYVPMQEDETVWEKMVGRYQFNVIYFFRRDMTPWAQPFLIRKIQDPSWAPIFVDDYTVILVKRNEHNARLVEQHELPRGLFRIEK